MMVSATNGVHRKERVDEPHVLITGGIGFVGTNLAGRLLREGHRVTIIDNMARAGVVWNAAHLLGQYGNRVKIMAVDVRDRGVLRDALRRASAVVHLAAQVAVTSSLDDPAADLDVNIGGTFSLLEELRALGREVPLIFTSTNKVYGNLADVELRQAGDRYEPVDAGMRDRGVSERRRLDFHNPYGCSKGAADQYVLDYARSFGLATCVFRMSCIYGRHQRGNEDQGWVAHIVKSVLDDRPITIYGDGRQVRDVLYCGDLVEALVRALADFGRVRGRAFNMGGGPRNTLSLLELLDALRESGLEPRVDYGDWRQGDQRWYVSDTRAFEELTGWSAKVSVRDGLSRLTTWLREAQEQDSSRNMPGVRRREVVSS